MDITIISDITKINCEEWKTFLENHAYGSVFQSRYMYKAYELAPKQNPGIYVAFKEKSIVGILVVIIQEPINSIVPHLTSRSLIWGGPVVKNNDPEIAYKLLSEFETYNKNKGVYTQIRNIFPSHYYGSVFKKLNYKFEEHLNILLDLSKTKKELWDDVSSKGKNKIRNAQNSNLHFDVKQDYETLNKSYRLLETVYRNAGLPLINIKFFKNLLDLSDQYSELKIFTLNLNGEITACRFALLYKNSIYDFYAGWDKSFSHLHPNDLIMWEIIKWGKANNYTVLDFGGAGKPDVPYGVRNFKKKFGGEIVNYGRYEKIHSVVKFAIAKKGFRLWQKIMSKKAN